VKDADGVPWEMYTLLADVEAETAADRELRRFLGQQATPSLAEAAAGAATAARCCVPDGLTNIEPNR
jgi:hypothetical protein